MKDIDFKDPFNAGQMMGMLVILTFIEQQKGIHEKTLSEIKSAVVHNLQVYIDKPEEDIYLIVDEMVKEI